MAVFSEETLSLLRHAGWYKKRHVDISIWIDSLQQKDYPIFPCINEFLSVYGGLRIMYAHANDPEDTRELQFDRVDAAGVRHTQLASVKLGGKPLCPIGSCEDGSIPLWMDVNSKVYLAFGDYFACAGHSGEEAIENICTNRSKIKQIKYKKTNS